MIPKLSPYTIATNCTDITDCNYGIDEIFAAYDEYKRNGKKVPGHFLSRLEKLEAKRDKCCIKEHGVKYDEYILSKPLQGTKKTATALTVTVIKSSSFITLPQAFKRRSTTTKPRLVSCTVNGISAKAKVKQFVDKSKLMDLINDFNIDNAEDFIAAIGRCFPQQLYKEESNTDAEFKSKYQLLDFSDFGVKILFRISDHNINCDNITDDIEEAYSIALKSKRSRNTFKPNDLTVTEYVYFTENCDRHRYHLIALELLAFLETSEWNNDFVPADIVNHSPERENLQGIQIKGFVQQIGSNDPNWFDVEELKRRLADADKTEETVEKLLATAAKQAGITAEPQPEPSQDETQNASATYQFAEALADRYNMGEKFDWAKAKKMAVLFKIGSEQEVMQACELAVVLQARNIAQNGQSIAQRYAALLDLYDQQITIRPLDTQGKILQQYSTPCPLAFLLGTFVLPKNYNAQWGYFLEPSAGNGMLTIALPESRTIVNEIDSIRAENLKAQNFMKVLSVDASKESGKADKFIGIITNPPFAKLDAKDKIERHGWAINTLDYKMAVLALDSMQNDGRAAIIVGGKMWNSYWKPLSERSNKKVLFGQWKTFLGYLYAQYNVVDVIYMNGDNIYRKQGTTYPIVAILIDGRHGYDESNKPNYVFDPERDVIIDTFDQLFDRIMPYLENKSETDETERKRKLLLLAKAKIKIAKAQQSVKNAKSEQRTAHNNILTQSEIADLKEDGYSEKDIPQIEEVANLATYRLAKMPETEDNLDKFERIAKTVSLDDACKFVDRREIIFGIARLAFHGWNGSVFRGNDKYSLEIYMPKSYWLGGVDDECIERIENLHKAADTINISGIDDYKTFIKNALSSNNRDKIECTELISEHSKKIVNYLLNKNITKYYIKSTDIRHAKNKHGRQVEYQYGQIPITNADLMKIPEILSEPSNIDLPSANSKNGQGIRFIKEYPDGRIYCVMVDEYETDELSVKTSYKKSPLQGNDAIIDPKLNVRNARALPMLSANITNFFRIQ